MRTLYGDDGLGLDLSPILQAAQTGANIYSQVETTRRPPAAPAAALPPVVNVTAPSGGGSGGGGKTLSYIVLGMAVLGAGFIAWRAFGPRRSGR